MDIRTVKEQQKNNSGFTLLELVISVAILSLIAIIGGQMMVTSANSYSSLHRSVSLSQASKQVTEQMSENSIDSSAAVVGPQNIDGSSISTIYFVEYTGKVSYGTSDNATYTDNTNISGEEYNAIKNNNQYAIHAYKYNSDKHILYYGEVPGTTLSYSYLKSLVDQIDYVPLCENFDDNGFSTSLTVEQKASDRSGDNVMINYAKRMQMTLTLKKRDKRFKAENDTYFRGRTVYAKDFNELCKTPYMEEVNER